MAACSSRLSPQNAARLLQKLSTERDDEASREKSVFELKQMNALAKKVTIQHCQPHQPVIHTTQPTTTPAQLQVASESSPVVSEQPTISHHKETSFQQLVTATPMQTATRTQPVALGTGSVADVKTIKQYLERKFFDLVTSTLSALERHNHGAFRDYLLILPVAKNATHVKFFGESKDGILAARNIHQLFAILSHHWSYRNYGILHKIINSFCDDQLQERMQEYCKMLENFELDTTVEVYTTAIISDEANEELKAGFSKMAVKIDRPAAECMLYEVRKLNEALIKGSPLCSHSVNIYSVANKCVEVVVRFPSSAVGWVLAAMTPNFIHTHHLTEVAVDGKQLETERDELNNELITASKAGDVVRVVSLLNSGADINTGAEEGSGTALDIASYRGHLQVVRLLLHRGAELEIGDKAGWTPLISAAACGECDVVIDLLDSGADVNAQRKDGDSALLRAVWDGHTETVVELVKAKANLDLQNSYGDSALIRAANRDKTQVVAELVQAGAQLDLQNKEGDSTLMRAARWGHTEIITELVKAKANLDLQNNRVDSAVIQATVRYKSDALRVLVGAGSDLNLQNEDGLTALMIAVRSERSDITDILLEGEHIDLDIQENSTGWSALFFSAERGDVATTQSLLTAGANVHLKDKSGLTALEVATASERDTDGVCELLTLSLATPHSHPGTHSPVMDSSAASDQIISISGQRRRRRRVPQITEALWNLVNVSGQRIQQIFNQLDRRLKSADKKTQSGDRDKEQYTSLKAERDELPQIELESYQYAFQAHIEKYYEDIVIITAFPNQSSYSQASKWNVEEFFPKNEFRPTRVVPINIEGDKLMVQWQTHSDWEIVSNLSPCEISRKMLDDANYVPYPPFVVITFFLKNLSSRQPYYAISNWM